MNRAEADTLRGGAPPKIAVEGLHKAFGGKSVLCGVDLQILEGESLVILGSSGGGKSVLLKHMIGLMSPDKGRVLIDGRDMTHRSPADWYEVRRRCGMAFQEGALFDSMNVFDNIAFPLRRHTKMKPKEIAQRVAECLELVQLPGIEKKLVNQLSGGMRRRVGFARAIALGPEIMLFDEPNTGLDPITSSAIDHVIAQLKQKTGVTMVTITHQVRSISNIADRVAMLYRGRIAAVAPPDEFRALKDPYIAHFLAGRPLEEEVV